jgi:hypothetical protein
VSALDLDLIIAAEEDDPGAIIRNEDTLQRLAALDADGRKLWAEKLKASSIPVDSQATITAAIGNARAAQKRARVPQWRHQPPSGTKAERHRWPCPIHYRLVGANASFNLAEFLAVRPGEVISSKVSVLYDLDERGIWREVEPLTIATEIRGTDPGRNL